MDVRVSSRKETAKEKHSATESKKELKRIEDEYNSKRTELIDALTLVTQLSPLAHDARSQLIYLSLLEPRPAKKNLDAAAAQFRQRRKLSGLSTSSAN